MTKQKTKNLTTKADGLVKDAAERSPRRRPSASRRLSVKFTEPSLTQQQFKASVDVNNIVRHYAQTGIDPYADRKDSQHFGAMTSKSFTDAMYQVAEVHSQFHELPAQERARFSNAPERWLAHMEAQALAPQEIVQPDASQGVTEDAPASDPQSDHAGSDAENIT